MPVLLDSNRAPPLSALLRAIPGGLVQSVVAGEDQQLDPCIAGLGALASAGPAEISFIVHAKYLEHLAQTKACAVIVLPEIEAHLASQSPPPTFASILIFFMPVSPNGLSGRYRLLVSLRFILVLSWTPQRFLVPVSRLVLTQLWALAARSVG